MTPPEVLLKAARKVCPGDSWVISKSTGLPFNGAGYFDIEDGDDQMALQIALEDDWIFTRGKHGFQATKKDDSVILYGQNKPDLLLAIVREGV